ncbi:metal-dependent hydrolase family protein [Portibacter marinus]|uniref:metal-dependent hydrolase family protein n=1 Tax=Portibacter marinus TaxID=2898660 RepID=UPI001F409E64|nr:amidohydrolase family protein [Portibacter marinus]
MISRIYLFILLFTNVLSAQTSSYTLINADWVFDGENMHENWQVLVLEDLIVEVGAKVSIPTGAKITTLDFSESTLMPGMIEGHSHLLLHPYNETDWNDQVLKESHAERAIRGANHAKATLNSGFTTVRDLGSEGAGYVDVGLKQSIEKGIIPGPRMIVAGKAIVTTGSYGPKGFHEFVKVPLGAEPADGYDDIIKVVRDQIGHGADLIKVYADYRWGLGGTAMPTFTQEELELMVKIAESSGRKVVAHAASAEGMRRATLAGVSTIEHGDGGTKEVFELMREKGVALCPTLAAGDAIMQYRGWKKGVDEEPKRIKDKKASFTQALQSGVTIVAGGDVGVFTHGENVRELEMMVEYGMNSMEVLKSVTSVNANVFGYGAEIGSLRKGLKADLVVVKGNPQEDISNLRNVEWVMQNGQVARE